MVVETYKYSILPVLRFVQRIEQVGRSPLGLQQIVFEIRPHRFGGEGVLIGVQTAILNAQSH